MPYSPGVSGNLDGRPPALESIWSRLLVELGRLERVRDRADATRKRLMMAGLLQGVDDPAEMDLAEADRLRDEYSAGIKHLRRIVEALRGDGEQLLRLLAHGSEVVERRRAKGRRRQRNIEEREQALVELGAWLERTVGHGGEQAS